MDTTGPREVGDGVDHILEALNTIAFQRGSMQHCDAAVVF